METSCGVLRLAHHARVWSWRPRRLCKRCCGRDGARDRRRGRRTKRGRGLGTKACVKLGRFGFPGTSDRTVRRVRVLSGRHGARRAGMDVPALAAKLARSGDKPLARRGRAPQIGTHKGPVVHRSTRRADVGKFAVAIQCTRVAVEMVTRLDVVGPVARCMAQFDPRNRRSPVVVSCKGLARRTGIDQDDVAACTRDS